MKYEELKSFLLRWIAMHDEKTFKGDKGPEKLVESLSVEVTGYDVGPGDFRYLSAFRKLKQEARLMLAARALHDAAQHRYFWRAVQQPPVTLWPKEVIKIFLSPIVRMIPDGKLIEHHLMDLLMDVQKNAITVSELEKD